MGALQCSRRVASSQLYVAPHEILDPDMPGLEDSSDGSDTTCTDPDMPGLVESDLPQQEDHGHAHHGGPDMTLLQSQLCFFCHHGPLTTWTFMPQTWPDSDADDSSTSASTSTRTGPSSATDEFGDF